MSVEELIGRVNWFASLIFAGPMPRISAPGFRMGKAIIGVVAFILFGASSLAAQGKQVFKGEICLGPGGRTAILEDTQTTERCNVEGAKRGANYVLANFENKTVYQLDGHKKLKDFAGDNVVVVGSLDQIAGTIHVDDVYRALPPKVARARSVHIGCDGCVRGMAAAWLAAFQELTEWGKFDIVPDPRKADLIFLFSANPYLGDYVTRDGPDKRPVRVDITYMDVVDPRTGESLWGDSRRWGALFVAKATKDLITAFKEELEFEERFQTR
jgi:hypothetical protein